MTAGATDDDSYNSDISDFSADNLSFNHPTSSRTKSVSAALTPTTQRSKSQAPKRDAALGDDIQRYCKETDRSVAEVRKKDRLSLFSVYADFDTEDRCNGDFEDAVKFFKDGDLAAPFQPQDKASLRVLVSLENLDFPLKVAQDGSKQFNVSFHPALYSTFQFCN